LLPDFRVRQRDYLLEISRAMTQELDFEKLLARILYISLEMLAGQAGLIALREEQGGWTVAASYGLPPGFLEQLSPLLASLPEHNEPQLSELPEVNRLLERMMRVSSLGLLTGVVLPLIARRQVVGVLFVFRNYPGVFSSNDTALLQSFADQAAIAVSNAKLYRQVIYEKRRITGLLDSAADGILILLGDHSIERCNPAMLRMLGLASDQVLTKGHEDVIRLARVKEGQTLEQAEAQGWPPTPNATLYVEGDLERHGVQPLPVGITYAPLVSQEGELVNIIATVRDITRFREADELKSTFVSVVSHELKTPIALIKGYVSTLRREDASWDRAIIKDSLEVIEEEADRLTEMVENLLDATRLQAGALSMNLCDVSLRSLVKRIADRFQTQTSNHTIILDIPEDFPIILGDELRLEQVVANLISNAIKYSPQGGEIRINGQVRSQQLMICISDQGPGIAPSDIPHVFDRFYRSSDFAKITKGAGLGLYLARAVIEAHGGRIWVDPKPDQGAKICFSLPRDALSSQIELSANY
jgi:signal transduction histidine kinase